jgi:hypothetical protein
MHEKKRAAARATAHYQHTNYSLQQKQTVQEEVSSLNEDEAFLMELERENREIENELHAL